MATQTILIDDIDGSTATQTIIFAINHEPYSLDLNDKNAKKFWEALQPFIDAAKGLKQAHQQEVEAEAAAVTQRQTIRDWARKKGYDVAARGKIPQEVIDAYNSTHH